MEYVMITPRNPICDDRNKKTTGGMQMKKLFAVMLALVMLATMATSALAVNEDI